MNKTVAGIQNKYDMLDDLSLIVAGVNCRDPPIWCWSDKGDPRQVCNIATKVGSAVVQITVATAGDFTNTMGTPFR